MTFPAGVETRTVRLQLPLDTLGNPPKVYTGTVRPNIALIWAATGDRLWPIAARLPQAVDGFLEFEVPIVDQDGWVDKDGDPVTDWTYRLLVTGTWDVSRRSMNKYFQVTESTPDPVDIELLPDAPSMPPVVEGDPYVASIAGYTGVVTGEQLRSALGGNVGGQGWKPESFGDGAPGYPNDDSPAILQAFAAAAAFGGPVELQAGKTYGCSGDFLQKNGVAVRGAGANAYGNGNATRLKAIDSTFRYRWGSASAGGANFPAELENVVIDGDEIAGAGHELLRVEAVDTTLTNVAVVNSAGDGMVLHNAQNLTLVNPRIDNCPAGTAYKVQNNDEATSGGSPFNGQAGGHNIVFGGHITRSYRLFHMDYDDVAGGTLNFWPHDNMFFGTIFEQYQSTVADGLSVDCLGRLSDGETRFFGCTFTGSSGMLDVDQDPRCLVLVENQKRPAMPTYATFDSCDFGGGANGVVDLVRSVSYGVANAIRVYGKTQVNAADYFLCDDRSGGGLGVTGGVFGPVDGLSVDDVTGMHLSRGINGGNGGSFVTQIRQPIRLVGDSTQGRMLQFRRLGEAANRGSIDRDFALRWTDEVTGATLASIVKDNTTDFMAMSGVWSFLGGVVRAVINPLDPAPVLTQLAADGAIVIDAKATSTHLIYFQANGVDATSITVNNATQAHQLRVGLFGTGTNVVTWAGSTLHFASDEVQPVAGTWIFVDFEYRQNPATLVWGYYEVSRSGGGAGGGTPGADGASAYDIAVAHGFVGTETEWLDSLNGTDGVDGDDGTAATIGIGTVTTGEPGDPADVENSGTSSAAVLDFVIPRGLSGPSGQPGPPMPIGVPAVAAPSAGATLAVTPLGGVMWDVMLSGNITLTATDLHPGQFIYVGLTQDATGGRTVTLDTSWANRAEAAASMVTTANYHNVLLVWMNSWGGTCVKHIGAMASAPAWTPASLTNQHDWFTADSLPVTSEDAEILAWENLVTTGADMTAPGGAGTGPTLRILNGKKYLEFDGGDNYLESTFASISPPFTIALVVRVNETTGLVPVVNGPSTGNTDLFVDGSPTRTWRANSSGATQTSTGDWETIVAHIKNDTTGYIRRNGSQTTVNTGGAALTGLRIARQVALSTNYGQIDLSELILATKTPAGTDVADIENYLNPKRDQLRGL